MCLVIPPNLSLVVSSRGPAFTTASTTTLTGNRLARKRYSHLTRVIFFPFDLSLILSRVIRIIRPKIFIAVETEIWPNLFYQLAARKIPAVIINGRISDRAFARYKLIRPLFKRTVNKCRAIAVQNKSYKQRFEYLGADPRKIVISGNMKFESIRINQEACLEIERRYRPYLKLDGKLLFVAGCTHPGEEAILLGVYKDLAESLDDVKFLIAPRHPERAGVLEKLIRSQGFVPFKVSQLGSCSVEAIDNKKAVFILDTVGELLYFYSLSDICFVGGSLTADGGHNILEPIYFEKPVFFGQHMDNFLDVEAVVLEKGAGIKVIGLEAFQETLISLVKDKALRINLSNRCREVFRQERQSLEKNLKIVLQCLS